MSSFLIVHARVAQRTWVREYSGFRHRNRAALAKYDQERAGVEGAVILVEEAETLEEVRDRLPELFLGAVDIV